MDLFRVHLDAAERHFLAPQASSATVTSNPKSAAARAVASMHICDMAQQIVTFRILLSCSNASRPVSRKLLG